MARFAIGDIQGCYAELRALLKRCAFRSDRDELWFVGDLVNRGPDSLQVLRFVKALGDNAITVLGNHDLHLLAIALGAKRAPRPDDTLDDVLAARDRDALLEWLLARPLAHRDAARGDLLIHAGLLPQWSARDALRIAHDVAADLRKDPGRVFADMYGNTPDVWSEKLDATARRRVAINVLTRMRYCTAAGHINVKLKGAPGSAPEPWLPWFSVPDRASRDTRIIFGHWSTLGWHDGDNVIALDTGCVWGGALTAVQLDANAEPAAPRERRLPRFGVPCAMSSTPGGE
jgi:bis(5'-nucleosyl)-tetraphosphatase (symmetrical)